MTARHRWGIVGTGGIAGAFAADLALLDEAELVAVGSRTPAGAEAFGARHDVPHRHGSYAALADDPDVEVVFVATPSPSHHADVLRLIEAGKHVVTGKPLTSSAAQSEEVVAAAAARGRFLMEGLWSRFLPAHVALRAVLAEGRIGTPRFVTADFGAAIAFDPAHRLFDPTVGGGAVHNLAIYPLQLALMVLGPSTDVVVAGDRGPTGVEETVVATLAHGDGGRSVATASLRVDLACEARITGTDGHIDLPRYMHKPDHLVVTDGSGTERIDAPFAGTGLRFQAAEAQVRIAAGEQQSPIVPWTETIRLAHLTDRCRSQIP